MADAILATTGDQGPPALKNDPDLTAFVMPALERASGHPVNTVQPQTVAEDFSEYAKVAPAVFVFLGNWPEELEPATQPTNHSPYASIPVTSVCRRPAHQVAIPISFSVCPTFWQPESTAIWIGCRMSCPLAGEETEDFVGRFGL